MLKKESPRSLCMPACLSLLLCVPQSAQGILTMFDERLQRQALESLAQSGVEVRTGVRVTEVTQDQARSLTRKHLAVEGMGCLGNMSTLQRWPNGLFTVHAVAGVVERE